jgi:HTH-type transcriptional regulator/antitoxin HigA
MKIYTIIRTDQQYMTYCNDLEKMTSDYKINSSDVLLDMIDTIALFIEKYDEEHSQLNEVDPIRLLKSLMNDNNLKQKDLADLLKVSKGHLSDILN